MVSPLRMAGGSGIVRIGWRRIRAFAVVAALLAGQWASGAQAATDGVLELRTAEFLRSDDALPPAAEGHARS